MDDPRREGTVVVSFTTSKGRPTPESQTLEWGRKVVRPEVDPSRYGYDFEDWYTEAEGGEIWNFDNAVEQSLTLHARWKADSVIVLQNEEDFGDPYVRGFNVSNGDEWADVLGIITAEEGDFVINLSREINVEKEIRFNREIKLSLRGSGKIVSRDGLFYIGRNQSLIVQGPILEGSYSNRDPLLRVIDGS